MPTTKPKPLMTKREREMVAETMSNPNPTAANLRWAHDLIARTMVRHGIKPYPKKR